MGLAIHRQENDASGERVIERLPEEDPAALQLAEVADAPMPIGGGNHEIEACAGCNRLIYVVLLKL